MVLDEAYYFQLLGLGRFLIELFYALDQLLRVNSLTAEVYYQNLYFDSTAGLFQIVLELLHDDGVGHGHRAKLFETALNHMF